MTQHVLTHPENAEPNRFTTDQLGWLPWLEPLVEERLAPRHWDGLVDASRAKSPYFMLLAHDPEVLGARTRTDKDIFYNTRSGLPRAERELAATAVSRTNGCIFCASVHARFASHHAKNNRGDIKRLLDEGPDLPLTGRWGAIVRAAAALSVMPLAFGTATIAELDRVGLTDDEIVDLIQSAAFFNWANRLMLSLGEPTPPQRD